MIFNEQTVFARYPYRGQGAFVDVGANKGEFLDPFAKRGWTVVAFEPHPGLFADLQRQYSDRPNVRCVQRAISDQPGKLPFYTSEEHPGIHSLAPFHSTHKATQEVEVATLEGELTRLEVSEVTALKIDVEGADLLALRSFDFTRSYPELVMVEFMDDRSAKHFGYTHHDVADFMLGQGYGTWVSEWAPLIEYARADAVPHNWIGFHRYDPSGQPAHGNLLFVRPPDEPLLMRAVRSAVWEMRARQITNVARAVPGARRLGRLGKRALPRRHGG